MKNVILFILCCYFLTVSGAVAEEVGQFTFQVLEIHGKTCLLVEYLEPVINDTEVDLVVAKLRLEITGVVDPAFKRFQLNVIAWQPNMNLAEIETNNVGSYWYTENESFYFDLTHCSVIEEGIFKVYALLGDFTFDSQIEMLQISSQKSNEQPKLRLLTGRNSHILGNERYVGGAVRPNRNDRKEGINPTIVAFPNPFNSTIEFQFSEFDENDESGQFMVYDVRGRLLFSTDIDASHGGTVMWKGLANDGSALPSGMYMAIFKANRSGKIGRKSVLLLK